MVETMRLEGHKALVHTAAASNLGQMLQKVCLADDVPLVNIVRKPEQAELLRDIGAKHVCNSSEPTFSKDLIDAVSATGATLAFDAVGGGGLASQILTAMEVAAASDAESYTPYGSAIHKQVYIYGALDRGPTELIRNFGMTWGVGGWLLTPFLQRIGPRMLELQMRVAREIKTTFASSYTREVVSCGSAHARRDCGLRTQGNWDQVPDQPEQVLKGRAQRPRATDWIRTALRAAATQPYGLRNRCRRFRDVRVRRSSID